MLRTTTRADALTAHYQHVRSLTEQLAAPLSAEDQIVQSMPDVSPTKWHRAHTTWFFETFVLLPHLAGYLEHDPVFGYLFNSYYETVGARHPRAQRGLVSRPSVAEVGEYRSVVDAAMAEFLADVDDDAREVLDLVELGLHHEQQHQELLLMDIKHVLSVNPTNPAYQDGGPVVLADAPPLEWSEFDGGVAQIGHDGNGFAFDNELPRHSTLLQPFALANRLVTCGEWLEFIADRGYERPTLWLSEGWATVQAEQWHAPEYWYRLDGDWQVFTLDGLRSIDLAEPVCHVSLYEADAFARWAGARLPLEAEWEVVASRHALDGNFVSNGRLHPAPAAGPGMQQLFGDVWEWTSSPYGPYPGFTTAPGAVGEYNGKFMINQTVLRGGSCATPDGHTRPTYRNFFPAHSRWMFSGVRLAKDVS